MTTFAWEQQAQLMLVLQNRSSAQIQQVIDWFKRYSAVEELNLVGPDVARTFPDLGSPDANISVRLPLYAQYILGDLQYRPVSSVSEEYLRFQLSHIITECERSRTQSVRIQRIYRRAKAALEGKAPDFSGVDKNRSNKLGKMQATVARVSLQHEELLAALANLRKLDPVKHARTMNIGPLYVQFYAQTQEVLAQALDEPQQSEG